jgi:hypothetical protein
MKKILVYILSVLCIFALCACSKKADADVLIREAKTNADNIKNCTADISNNLEFTVNGKHYTYKTTNKNLYFSEPFSLKSTQFSQIGGKADDSVSYTVTDSSGVWFYINTGNGWQKTSAETVSTLPTDQIDVLRMLNHVSGQKYVRETELDSKKVHKLELTFKSDVIQSTIETIVTASGMGNGSKTIVKTLLDSVPEVYGYCYIDTQSGQIVRIELSAEDAVNKIFKNIDSSQVIINVSKCEISGNVEDIGKAPAVQLPPEAAAAKTVKAAG